MDQNQAIETLREARGEFPQSLVAQFDRRGSLSDKQWHWVVKLASERVSERVEADKPGDYLRIVELLQRAQQHLKYPKLWLDSEETGPLRLHLAGPRSRHHGQVQITDGAPYGRNTYYGRISEAGQLHASASVTPAVQEVMTSLAGDPVGVTATHGKATGNCCFCSKALSDARSLEAGYGPTCAGHWHLPWGD